MPATEWRRSRLARSGWRRVRAAWRLRRADAILLPSLTAGLATAVPLALLTAAGHRELLGAAATGTFTALYGRNEPYAIRGRILAVVGAWLVLGALVGSLASLLPGRVWGLVPVALFAAASKLLADASRVGGPGAIFPSFAVALAAERPLTVSDVGPVTAVAALSAAWCWLLLMSPALWRPYAPDRIHLARALEAAATRIDALDGRDEAAARQQAGLAMQRAWRAITARRSPTWQSARLEAVAAWGESGIRQARAWSDALAADPTTEVPWEQLNDHSQDLAAMAARLRAWGPLPELPGEETLPATRQAARAAARWSHPARQLVLRPRQEPWGASVLRLRPRSPLVPLAVRVLLAALLAGLVAAGLGLDHLAWAAVSAVAVLAGMNRQVTFDRGVQRFLGTALGLVVGLSALMLRPDEWTTVALVVAASIGAELAAEVNYVLCLMAATPLTLLLASLSPHTSPLGLAWDRLVTTAVGIVAAVLCALIVRNRLLGPELARAMDDVRALQTEAEQALASTAWRPRTDVAARLMSALLELRDVYAQAQGEPWPEGLPAEEVSRLEAEGYRALARLTRPPRGL